MTDIQPDEAQADAKPANQLARARMRLVWGKACLEAEVHISPTGLLAIGGLVGAILLAAVPIVRAAAAARARR